jgi:hypothetical protein
MSQPPENETNKHIFQAICPKGHVQNYDKREVCPKNGSTYLGRKGKCQSEVLLTCKECQIGFYVEIDCEGYV